MMAQAAIEPEQASRKMQRQEHTLVDLRFLKKDPILIEPRSIRTHLVSDPN